MTRRGAALASAGLLLAGLAGGALLLGRIDQETVRAGLIARTERATGRPVALGRVQVRLLPAPALVAEDALLGPAAGSAVGAMRAQTVTARPAWTSLLMGRIAVDAVALRHVTVELEAGAAGGHRVLSIPALSIGFASDAADAPPSRLVAEGWAREGIAGLPAGLTLDRASLETGADGVLRTEARGAWNGVAWRGGGELGDGAAWRTGRPVAFGLDGALGGAAWSLHGGLERPHALAGLAATAWLRIPDLSVWSALAKRPLPPWRDLSASASLRDAGGLASGLAVSDLHVVAPPLDLAGEIGFGFGARPSLRAVLAAGRLDADLLRQAWPPAGAAPPSASSAPSAPPPNIDPVPDVVPDWSWVRNRDLDARIGIGALRAGGLSFHDLALHAVAQAGVLRIDPLAASGPGGAMAGGLVADARTPLVPLTLILRAPELRLTGLLEAFALPAQAQGALALDAELQGPGRSLRGFVSGLGGHLGASLQDGELSAGAVEALADLAARAARLPLPLIGGAAPLRCVALRIEATNGRARLPALLADAGMLRLAGGGGIDLAARTLSLALRPALRLRTGGVEWDARLEGPWGAPRLQIGKAAGGGLDFLGLLPRAARDEAGCAEQLAVARGAAS